MSTVVSLDGLVRLEAELRSEAPLADPESAAALLHLALKAPNVQLALAALQCLPHYFPRLVPRESPEAGSPSSTSSSSAASHALKVELVALLPVDRLGDSKEKIRELAREAIISAAQTALRLGTTPTSAGKESEGPWAYLQRVMEESAFRSKNAKAREQAIHYVLALRSPSSSPPAPLRPFTALLLPLLADADPAVRALALSTTITVFSASNVSAPAKADLKQEMVKRAVAKKVQDAILAAVLGGGADQRMSASTAGSTAPDSAISPKSSPSIRSRPLPRPSTIPTTLPAAAFSSEPLPGAADTRPIFIASERDLATEFEAMKAGFEGKETEHNWMVRDKSIGRIRGMIKGGVTDGEFLQSFLVALKNVLEGVLKTASSLRTTLATSALSLISELSTSLGPSLDPLLEPLLSHCLSMAGQTKKIVATASQSAATSLISNSAYHLKTIQLLWTGMNDKIVLARTFISAHVVTFIKVHGEHSWAIVESSGGLEILELCLKKGLVDPNPIVKENTRAAYWLSSTIWPQMTTRVVGGLDPATKKALDKADPTKGTVAAVAAPVKVARPSMRALMMAKAAAAEETSQPLASGSTPSHLPTKTPPKGLSRSRPSQPVTKVPRQDSEEAGALLTVSSPFRLDDQEDISFEFDKSQGSVEAYERRARSFSMSVEPVVDAALRDQAAQAEEAAQRLLEIAQEEHEEEPTRGEATPGRGPPNSLFQRTPTGNKNGLQVPLGGDVFADSPDVRNGQGAAGLAGRKNWWMTKKSQDLSPIPVLVADTPARIGEIDALVTSFQAGTIDLTGLQQLALLCQERPLRSEPEEDGDVLPSTTPTPSNAAFWLEGRRFSTIFDSLKLVLRSVENLEQREAHYLLLKALVLHQFPCFSNEEVGVFLLLLELREDTTRSSIAAVEAIADVFCSELEPLYGLLSLTSSLTSYLDSKLVDGGFSLPVALSYAFALRLCGKLFARLPAEVLEEELPKLKLLLKQAFNDTRGELRRAAVTALVAAHVVLQDDQKLYLIIDGLATDQKNLLAYYFHKQ